MKEEKTSHTSFLESNKKVRGTKLGNDYEKEVLKNELDRREKEHKLKPNEQRYEKFQKNVLLTDGQKIELIAQTVDQLARERLAELRHERELTEQSRLKQSLEPKLKLTIPKRSGFGPGL